jgi:hypothetical protein
MATLRQQLAQLRLDPGRVMQQAPGLQPAFQLAQTCSRGWSAATRRKRRGSACMRAA